jgi:hypothetical protein
MIPRTFFPAHAVWWRGEMLSTAILVKGKMLHWGLVPVSNGYPLMNKPDAQREHKDGHPYWTLLTYSPILVSGGFVRAFVVIGAVLPDKPLP